MGRVTCFVLIAYWIALHFQALSLLVAYVTLVQWLPLISKGKDNISSLRFAAEIDSIQFQGCKHCTPKNFWSPHFPAPNVETESTFSSSFQGWKAIQEPRSWRERCKPSDTVRHGQVPNTDKCICFTAWWQLTSHLRYGRTGLLEKSSCEHCSWTGSLRTMLHDLTHIIYRA